MTEFTTQEALGRVAVIKPAPHVRSEIDRCFEIPTGLYAATVALYLGFLAVMAVALINPELVLPMVIFAFFIVAGFGTPALWARMNPEKQQRAMSWGTFRHRGVQTATGHLGAGAATVQVLILPALIFLWGITAAIIAIAVR
jgi:hypothetical protein